MSTSSSKTTQSVKRQNGGFVDFNIIMCKRVTKGLWLLSYTNAFIMYGFVFAKWEGYLKYGYDNGVMN